jgi:hypothetical protein
MSCPICDREIPIPGTRCPRCGRPGKRSVSAKAVVGVLVVGLLMAAFSTRLAFFVVLGGLALGLLYILEQLQPQRPPELTSYEIKEKTPFPGESQQFFEIPIPPFGDADSSTSTQIRVTWNITDAPTVTVQEGATNAAERLQQLQEMHERGLITAQEFAEKWAEILDGL